MKKLLSHLFLAAIVAVTFAACKSSSTSPSGGNLSESQFATTATGGDVRGTYTPNTPLMMFKIPDMLGVKFTLNFTTNSGSGTVKFEGSSASSGTYTTTDLKINAAGTLKAEMNGQVISEEPMDMGETSSVLQTSGTWRVEGAMIYFDDDSEGSGFTVNSSGMFLIPSMGEEMPGAQVVMAFRKQ